MDTTNANGFGEKVCQKNKLIEDNYIARPSRKAALAAAFRRQK